jgi:hypothetical protein
LKAPDQPPLLHRLAWFVGLWVAGVLVVGTIAFALRRVLIG